MTKSQRVAIVTGGAGGIGSAIVRELAMAKHPVAIGYSRNAARADALAAELAGTGADAMSVHCDVADRASLRLAFEAVRSAWGPPLVLVNNGGVRHVAAVGRLTASQWAESMSVNLTGPFHAMQCALPAMLDARWGRIVNVSSPAGSVPYMGGAAYGASKAGLNHLTRVTALEVARRNITVNAVSPGLVRTDMTEEMGDDGLDAALATQANPRFVEPDEVAAVVGFLVSDEAAMVNGQDIAVHGGGEASGRRPAQRS